MQTDANTTTGTRSWASRNIHSMALMGASAILLAATMSFPHVAHSLTSGVSGIPAVQLASGPLYASGSRAKPTLTLTLSVEFPTVGAAYRDSYNPNNKYIGYFDSSSCYKYNKTEDYFERYGNASTSAGCNGKGFHGNFMNWANTSSIDILRLGLTGGDRITDTANQTVLQRAVLQSSFYNNSSYFPAKNLPSAHIGKSIPDELKIKTDGTTHTGDIKISNCLNRIFFGTNQEGNCDNPARNGNLGQGSDPWPNGRLSQPQFISSNPIKNNYLKICNEYESCQFTGIRRVYFGVDNKWNWADVKNEIQCDWHSQYMGDPASGVGGKKCYVSNQTYEDEYQMAESLTSHNHFLARVQVCESGDPRGSNYCQRYPIGNYKPIGNLQKYSDRVRVSAFGYLMDNERKRYGGVLRAPMKFVGPKNYAANGSELPGENIHQEWNIQNGIFNINPHSASEGNSGVINYLNKFGRTGGTPGTYKGLDPVGELYYESLRYLQGLQPTPQAISWNRTSDVTKPIPDGYKDGFQVITSWDDPHADGVSTQDYSCVRNNIVLIGDVNTHSDKSLPGNTRTSNEDYNRSAEVDLTKNIPNFKTWTEVIAGFEKNEGVSYKDSSGTTRTTSNPNGKVFEMDANANTGSGGTSAYYIAGAAYWANTHDIRGADWTSENTDSRDNSKVRPGMRVKTYVIDVNEGGANSNYDTRKQRQFFLTAKYGGFTDKSGYGNPFKDNTGNTDNSSWSRNPNDTNKDPKSYFLVNDAQAILDGLDEIFATVVAEANSIANSAISSSSLSQGETALIYRGQFDVTDWSGDVVALPLNHIAATAATETAQGTNASVAIGTQVWSAAAKLASRTTARNIIIGKRDRTEATNFTWNAIESDLEDDLNASDDLGEDRLEYLRGDRTKEGDLFRVRGKLMGDIVNSGVVFSGKPSNLIADADYYGSTSIYQTKKDRTPTVFVGANDGMLHAFDARNDSTNGGTELFAYIPSWVGSKLAALTDKNYNVNGHQNYVDATPVVAEAKVGSTWKTVLVGGTGAGGQGVYALDVSDPANFTKDNVMWEFTDEDDASLGNVMGEPHILKVQTGTNTYKWFAVVASGVNNYVSDDSNASSTAKPALFFLDLGKAYDSDWALGTNYFKVELPVKTDLNMASGIVNFTPVINSAGVLERIYTGDLQGNLWRLTFKGRNISAGPTGNATPLFIAKDSSQNSKHQPISTAPVLFRADDQKVVVTFGTGKYLEEADNTNTQAQSFYAILDEEKPSASATDDSSNGSLVGRARLKAGTVNTTTQRVAVAAPFNWATIYQITSNAALTTNKRSDLYAGWYFDFPVNGERQISDGLVYGQYVMANSLVPPSANQGICGTGDSNSYIINVATGETEYDPSTVGLLGAPIILDVGEEYSVLNSVGQRVKKIISRIIQQGSKSGADGTAVGKEITRTLLTGRLNWRQIMNYEELRSKDYDDFVNP